MPSTAARGLFSRIRGTVAVDGRAVNADDEDFVTVVNEGTIVAGDDGIRLGSGASAEFRNAGEIVSGDEGFEAGDDATVSNLAGARIAATEDAVQVGERARIENEGTIESIGAGAGGDGIDIDSGEIVNLGTIRAVDGSGIDFDASTAPGSAIANAGIIEGVVGIEVELGGDDPANVAAQVVSNSGVIRGTGGVALELGEGNDILFLYDTLAGSAFDRLSTPIGETVDLGIFGRTDMGGGNDIVGFLPTLTSGMIYEGYLGDIFDGGEGSDLFAFGTLSGEVTATALMDGILSLTFGNGRDRRTLRLTGFEQFSFRDGGERVLTQAQVLALGMPAPIPLPAGVVLLAGGLVALGGLRRRRR